MSRFTVVAVLVLSGCVAPVDEAWEESQQESSYLVGEIDDPERFGGSDDAPIDDESTPFEWEESEELRDEGDEDLEPDPQPWEIDGTDVGSHGEPDPQPW